MRASTSTPYTSKARTLDLSRGPLPSSSGPQLHGWEIGSIFRQGQDPQGPPGMKIKLKRMMIWLMWWNSSFEEAESLGRDQLKLWTRLYFVLSLLVFVCYLIVIELDFILLLLVFVCYLIVIELDFMLSLSVFVCYLIVMKLYRFQRVVILLCCVGWSEARKLS